MDLAERRHSMRMKMLEIIRTEGSDMPVGLVRAVLGEVEQILMSASNNLTVRDVESQIQNNRYQKR